MTFQDWQGVLQGSIVKAGLAKIRRACAQALEDKLEYLWVDTNCIDKTSSAELSEAINSMFAWYRDAEVCYVYLVDVPDGVVRRVHESGEWVADDVFLRSRWFTRGWTLQELLAPAAVVFFSTDWKRLGTKSELKAPLSQTTGIPEVYLIGSGSVWRASIARRMSWMSKRVTTRTEDMAYSMLGIFDIHMPLIYGEGQRAFLRLQEEILRSTDDQSVLCWEWNKSHVDDNWASVLAPCPAAFKDMGEYIPTEWDGETEAVPYSISNGGMSIRLPLVPTASPDVLLAVLEVRPAWDDREDSRLPCTHQLCIPLKRGRVYRRLPFPNRPFLLDKAMVAQQTSIRIMARERRPAVRRGDINTSWEWPELYGKGATANFLIVFAAEAPEMDVLYVDSTLKAPHTNGVLGLSCCHGKVDAVAVLVLRFKDGHESLLLLAARRNAGTDNERAPSSFCQVLPMDRRSRIERVVADFKSKSMQANQHVDFSTDGVVTVALGNTLSKSYYSDMAGVRVAQVVYKDRNRCEILREKAEFPSSFVPVSEPTWMPYSRSGWR